MKQLIFKLIFTLRKHASASGAAAKSVMQDHAVPAGVPGCFAGQAMGRILVRGRRPLTSLLLFLFALPGFAQTPPDPPTNLTVTATTADSISLSWTAPSDDIVEYYIYRCEEGETPCTLLLANSVLSDDFEPPAPTSYTDTNTYGITAGTTYRYAVAALRDGNESAQSNQVTATAEGEVSVNPPTGLRVTAAGETTVTLSWNAPPDDGKGAIRSYEIYVWCGDDCTPGYRGFTRSTSYTVAGLVQGSTYAFVVAANRSGIRSSFAGPVSVVTTAIHPPRELSVTSTGETAITLDWAVPLDNGGAGPDSYNVYRCEGDGCTPALYETNISGTGFTDNSVTAAAGYAYAVTAVYAGPAESALSNLVTALAKTQRKERKNWSSGKGRPARPPGFKVTAVSPDSISLSWKPSPYDDEERPGYGIYRCTVPGGMTDCDPYDGLWLAYLEMHTYTDNEVIPGTTYRYQVAALPLGRENLSRPLTVVAQVQQTPPAPGKLTVMETSESYILLGWTMPDGDGSDPMDACDIYRCNLDDSPDCSEFMLLSSRNPVLTYYKDRDVTPGATYRYAVAAYRSSEDVAPWSNQVTALAQDEAIPEPEISVADAQVDEAPDTLLTFSVTLDSASPGAVTVRYSTEDDTATAGEDYTAVSGVLTFVAGETEKTVEVAVLDDAHDEGEETLTLTLSNASGARIADGRATGTIVNSDPIPKGWLARFGRTSAMQVVGIMNARFDEAGAPASQLTLGGRRLGIPARGVRQAQASPAVASDFSNDGISHAAPDFSVVPGLTRAPHMSDDDQDSGLRGEHRAGAPGTRRPNLLERAIWDLLTVTGNTGSTDRRRFLSESSFNLSLPGSGGEPGSSGSETLRPAGHWTVWGRGALARFAGKDAGMRLDGNVLTGLMGLDYANNRWLTGVALSYSDGYGAYRSATGEGKLNSALMSVHPYLRYALTERLSVWGVLGYGKGEMRLKQSLGGKDVGDSMQAGLRMGMGAVGIRGIVYASAATELALKSDVLWVNTSSEVTAGLAAADAADAGRVRLLLAGKHRRVLADGALLTPDVELGVRYDDGAAETGAGVELGGGLRYDSPLLGLTVETRARALLAHEDGSYEEWGLQGSVQVDPGRIGRGLSLRFDTGWGIADRGAEALWLRQEPAVLARQHGRAHGGRIRTEWSYGLDIPWTNGIQTPYGSVELADRDIRILRLGWRFVMGRTLHLSLDGERRESSLAQAEHSLMLRSSLPW